MQKKTTTINIKPMGFGTQKDVILTEDECFQLERGPIVIKHDKLLSLATAEQLSADEIVCDTATYMDQNNFSYVYRARTRVATGELVEEVGEANPANLDTQIAKLYPALMAHKRAYDRLILRLLGISGDVYSDTEISQYNADVKPLSGTAPAKETPKTAAEKKAAAEKAAAEKKAAEEKVETKVEEPIEENNEASTQDAVAETPSQEEAVVEEPVAEAPAEEPAETPAAASGTSGLDPESMSMEDFEANLNEDLALRTPAKFGSHKDKENFTLKDLIATDISSACWVKDTFNVTEKTREPMRKLKMAACYLADNNLVKFAQ